MMSEKQPNEMRDEKGEMRNLGTQYLASEKGEMKNEKNDADTGKKLEELNASVLLVKEEKSREKSVQKEKSETKQIIDKLQTEVQSNKHESITGNYAQKNKQSTPGNQQPGTRNYEQMTEEQIADLAEQGREQSAVAVQNVVNKSSFIPERLKRLTN